MNPSAASARCEGRSPEDEPMDDWLFLSSDSASPPSPEVSRSQETEDRGQLKSKLISAWNSVKYGLLSPPSRPDCFCIVRSVCSLLVRQIKKTVFSLPVHTSGWSLKQKSKFSKSSAVIMFGQSYELRDHGETLSRGPSNPPEILRVILKSKRGRGF